MPNDTLFPSIDGASPGDNKETVMSLDDTPILEPLFPQSDVGSAPSQVQDFDPATVEAVDAPVAPAPAEPTRRKSVQDRIDRLTKRNHEVKSQNDALAQQLAALAQQNQMLFAQLVNQRAPVGAPAAAPSADPFAGGETGAAQTPALDLRRQIAEAVRGEVAPISESLRNIHQSNAIRQAHEQSFSEAAEDYPELRDNSSEFRRVFNDLYDGAPAEVKRLPNAPMHLALQARGILADARRAEQTTTAKKRAATVHVPTPTATDEPTEGVIPKSIENAAEAARKRFRDGTNTAEDYALLRKLSQFKQLRNG